MHWAIAICMLLLLLTIFLRIGWMNKDHMADIMQAYLLENDVELSRDQLIVMAKKVRSPMWEWHIYLGYVLTGLYAIRLALPFFGQMSFASPFKKGLSMQVKFQFWVYLVFYVFMAVSLVTGLIIELGPKSLKEPVEAVHVLSIYYLLAFIFLHFGGILLAEFTKDKGIISRVIRG